MEKRVLTARWLQGTDYIPIYDDASVSTSRQRVREAGSRLGLPAEVTETAALIASELTNNQVAYARHGYMGIRPLERGGIRGLEIVAADIGPGIEKPREAIAGVMERSTSMGAGLGSVCRLADEVEFDTRVGEGACVIARKFQSRPPQAFWDVAVMSRPFPGEPVSGDDALVLQSESLFLAAIADGLGHGPEARRASNQAIESVLRDQNRDLAQTVLAVNRDLSDTRGCALALARFNKAGNRLECTAAGDVHAHMYHLRDAHFFASSPMVLGSSAPPRKRIHVEDVPVSAGSVLLMFTDGLKSRTNLKGQLDILREPPVVIAQHLLENDSRPDDDALVLVARCRQ